MGAGLCLALGVITLRRASPSIVRATLLWGGASVLGMLSLLPVGHVGQVLKLPLINHWAIAHSTVIVIWPLMTVICRAVLELVFSRGAAWDRH